MASIGGGGWKEKGVQVLVTKTEGKMSVGMLRRE